MEVVQQRILALLILIGIAVWSWFPFFSAPVCDPDLLCVVFFDVGQGDATFIQTPTGEQILIDGGRGSAVLRELGHTMSFWDRDLDLVVITHPDVDHIGGLIDVFKRYQVAAVARTENESDTQAWKELERLITEEQAVIDMARRGQQHYFGPDVVLETLFPDRDMSDSESNTASIVMQLTYGETAFLFTGDAPKSVEEYLVLVEGEALRSEVLKVGHHGSRTSTAELFLNEVQPSHAVISASTDNQYGHPHVEVTDALFNARVNTYSTAEAGSVVMWSDGKTVVVQ